MQAKTSNTGEPFLELEKSLIDATLEVFASMIFIDIAPETPLDSEVAVIEFNLSSLIGLAGDLKGILAIQCPQKWQWVSPGPCSAWK